MVAEEDAPKVPQQRSPRAFEQGRPEILQHVSRFRLVAEKGTPLQGCYRAPQACEEAHEQCPFYGASAPDPEQKKQGAASLRWA